MPRLRQPEQKEKGKCVWYITRFGGGIVTPAEMIVIIEK